MNPIFIEKTKNGEIIYDVPSRLLKDRVVFLNEEITDQSASTTSSLLYLLNQEDDTKPIDLWIDSPGGDVEGLFEIYDMMNFISAPVRTVCMGIACSAAAVLLACGTKGQRCVMPNSTVMIHQVRNYGGISGTETEIRISAKRMKYLKDKLNIILSEKTGQSIEKINIDTKNDKYLNAQEAIEYGLADMVLKNPKNEPKVIKKSASTKVKKPVK
jgi:ATP-dependent Clp protease protease subunit